VKIAELTSKMNKSDLLKLMCISENDHEVELRPKAFFILNFTGIEQYEKGLHIKVIRNVLAQIFRDEVLVVYHILQQAVTSKIEATEVLS
jgi:hypothetical protein